MLYVVRRKPANAPLAADRMRIRGRAATALGRRKELARAVATRHCRHARDLTGSDMIERAWAEEFARDWVESWNSHEVERVLAHYADNFEMTSPLIVQRFGIVDGKLKGKDAVRRYWGQGLANTPELRFKLIDVIISVNSVAIVYESVTLARTVVEYIEFNEQWLGVRAEALHGTVRQESESNA
jgi:ketosteroid isomerase-like protein